MDDGQILAAVAAEADAMHPADAVAARARNWPTAAAVCIHRDY